MRQSPSEIGQTVQILTGGVLRWSVERKGTGSATSCSLATPGNRHLIERVEAALQSSANLLGCERLAGLQIDGMLPPAGLHSVFVLDLCAWCAHVCEGWVAGLPRLGMESMLCKRPERGSCHAISQANQNALSAAAVGSADGRGCADRFGCFRRGKSTGRRERSVEFRLVAATVGRLQLVGRSQHDIGRSRRLGAATRFERFRCAREKEHGFLVSEQAGLHSPDCRVQPRSGPRPVIGGLQTTS